jgi:hypothetical protein
LIQNKPEKRASRISQERAMPEQSEMNTARQRDPKPDPLNLERNQPDPMLDMSGRRMGGGGFSIVALGIVVILALVFFGLNGRSETTAPMHTIPLASK